MSYLVLARKWRPRTFSQLVGQEHINKAIINSLNRQRLHHAYLFTGTRGVGKTSIARLLAKALNCENGISAEPCLKCNACLSIEQGHFIDLIEIDGASRTKVEDTRELLDNVQYVPTQGRFKIYLIDEVHMLSQHSFNALLKTLEEPPAHVKFLLATTDPQKLPITVLSRCLQFTLKPIPRDLIKSHLVSLLDDENLTFESEALDALAKAAKGSIRDALSLLDQAINTCNDKITLKEVHSILGYTHHDYAMDLLTALADFSAAKIIQISRQIAQEGGHFQYVLDELLNHLHEISIFKHLKTDHFTAINSSEIATLANQISQEDIQLFYSIGIQGCEEIYHAPTLAIGFEMLLLRMLTFRPVTNISMPKLALDVNHQEREEQRNTSQPSNNSVLLQEVNEQNLNFKNNEPSNKDSSLLREEWGEILSKLSLTGLSLNAAENSVFIKKEGALVTLSVMKSHESLFTSSVRSRLEKNLSTYLNESVKINIETVNEVIETSPAQKKQTASSQRQHEAERSLEADACFQQLKQEFSAELVKNSIVPIKDTL